MPVQTGAMRTLGPTDRETGTLRLGDDTYSFFFRECDPEGTDPDYVT